MPEFTLETTIGAPIDACFELSLSVDAHTASMEPSGERAVARVTSEQQRGPFACWWHEHTFVEVGPSMTSMVDVIRSPLGPLGRLVDRVVLGRYMPHLIRQRNAWLRHALEERE